VSTLYGLVLAGGRSTRMGRDKAAVAWHGRPALERAFELLSACTERAFVSLRAEQAGDPLRTALPHLVDGVAGQGPIAGIASAQAAHPEAAWLVLACDLPFVEAGTLRHLIGRRDPASLATAYRSAHDGLPEPLCAIWEPASRGPVLGFIGEGRHCPRKFLIMSGATLVDLPDPQALDNVNTPVELEAARSALSARGAA
jgi:molybdopterin-guanine dinucleotide biosynthesis protein A